MKDYLLKSFERNLPISIIYDNDVRFIMALKDRYSVDIGKNKSIRFGAQIRVSVPHHKVIVSDAAIRDDGIPIVFSKVRKYNIVDDHLQTLYAVRAGVFQINTIEVINRLVQLNDAIASLEECLMINNKTGDIDINTILNRHAIASPSDVWPMFRKQANSQYSRLQLAAHAFRHAINTKNDMLIDEMSKFVTEMGDLELRPAWADFSDLTIDI